jgi:hypothetical protein
LRSANGGAQHRDRGACRAQLAHELGKHAEVAVGAADLFGRQHVATAGFEHPEVTQVAADGGLRGLVALLLQQAHELGLLAHESRAQDAHDRAASFQLVGVGEHQRSLRINMRALCILMHESQATFP